MDSCEIETTLFKEQTIKFLTAFYGQRWKVCQKSHLETCFERLLKEGADVDAKDKSGRTILSRAAEADYPAIVK